DAANMCMKGALGAAWIQTVIKIVDGRLAHAGGGGQGHGSPIFETSKHKRLRHGIVALKSLSQLLDALAKLSEVLFEFPEDEIAPETVRQSLAVRSLGEWIRQEYQVERGRGIPPGFVAGRCCLSVLLEKERLAYPIRITEGLNR